MGFHALAVTQVDELTEDARAVTFAVPADLAQAYAFDAGQSVTLRRFVDGEEQRRTYSICAPVGAPLRIGVREIPDGVFSRWLVHDVRPGDVVEVDRPHGSFRADPSLGGRHLLVAAGSGITPILSIATTLLRTPDTEVILIYGNRTTRSAMFAEELADLKDSHLDRFELIHVLSREPREAELFSGRLEAERLSRILDALVPVDKVDHVWLCGPFALTRAARTMLLDRGMAPDRVHAELFYVGEPPPPLTHLDAVVDGETSQVTLVLDGRRTTTPMPRSMPVLDSAQRVRPDLPFACKGGVCGTCRAALTSGEVDMVRNFALEPHEVAQGYVLTCQSYPVTPSLTLDFDSSTPN